MIMLESSAESRGVLMNLVTPQPLPAKGQERAVLQILVNRLDLGMDLPAAVAAPRATQRNTAAVQAEPGFDRTALQALGHTFVDNPEIGAATAIEFLDDGSLLAVAEPVRRGGGSAAVVRGS